MQKEESEVESLMHELQSGGNIIERPFGGARINGNEVYRRISIRRMKHYEG